MNMRRSAFGLVCLIAIVLGCNDNEPPIPVSEQLAIDIDLIKNYLAENDLTATEDTTGVFYTIHTLGTGPIPSLSNCIRVGYTGKLLDGSQFEQSESLKSPLVNLITGWRIAFPKLPQGSVATLYIPSVYAYGRVARTGIPANSVLIFDVELFDVYAYNAVGAYCYDDPLLLPEEQLAIDTENIDAYLTANNIVAQTDASGLRYVVEQQGTGEMPVDGQCVRIKYSGRLLGSSTNFDQNNAGLKIAMTRLIDGLQTGLKLLNKGGKATFYIPSGQAYGATGSGARIPPNANLIFEVELVDIFGFNATTGTCD